MATDDRNSSRTGVGGQVRSWSNGLWRRLKGLSPRAKLALLGLAVFYMVLAFFLIVWPGAAWIGQELYNWAQGTSHQQYGWLVFVALITVASFPPALGHTTCLILCGFAYGLPGFFLAAGASVFAAAIVFVVLRLLFRSQLRAWSENNAKWQALESVIVGGILSCSYPMLKRKDKKTKGLPLICMIRMSPFPPWPYSNALFASIAPVKLWQFVVAQIFVFPKIFLSVFIGSRAAALADGDQRDKMDRVTKLANIGLIIFSMSVGLFTSWFVYRQVRQRIRQLEGISPVVDELAAEALEDTGEDEPLLGA